MSMQKCVLMNDWILKVSKMVEILNDALGEIFFSIFYI